MSKRGAMAGFLPAANCLQPPFRAPQAIDPLKVHLKQAQPPCMHWEILVHVLPAGKRWPQAICLSSDTVLPVQSL